MRLVHFFVHKFICERPGNEMDLEQHPWSATFKLFRDPSRCERSGAFYYPGGTNFLHFSCYFKACHKGFWSLYCVLFICIISYVKARSRRTTINCSQLAKFRKSIPLILLQWKLYGRSCWYKIITITYYAWKIKIFVNMWNLGQFLEKSIFYQ